MMAGTGTIHHGINYTLHYKKYRAIGFGLYQQIQNETETQTCLSIPPHTFNLLFKPHSSIHLSICQSVNLSIYQSVNSLEEQSDVSSSSSSISIEIKIHDGSPFNQSYLGLSTIPLHFKDIPTKLCSNYSSYSKKEKYKSNK